MAPDLLSSTQVCSTSKYGSKSYSFMHAFMFIIFSQQDLMSFPIIDAFLLQYSRHRHCIVGDGNCLFRSFSFIMNSSEDSHLDVRSQLVDFILLNASYFQEYCIPSTVAAHARSMRNLFVWGTHVEIYAMSLYLGVSVFVAMHKGNGQYYWAKYKLSQKTKLLLPTGTRLSLPMNTEHIELCHVNNCHYDVPVLSCGSISVCPPYIGDTSVCLPYIGDTSTSDGACSIIVID